MVEKQKMREILDESRDILYILEQKYGLSHPHVLKQSMLLDELINQYNRVYYVRS